MITFIRVESHVFACNTCKTLNKFSGPRSSTRPFAVVSPSCSPLCAVR